MRVARVRVRVQVVAASARDALGVAVGGARRARGRRAAVGARTLLVAAALRVRRARARRQHGLAQRVAVRVLHARAADQVAPRVA